MTEINEFMRGKTSWFNKFINNFPIIKNTNEFKKVDSIYPLEHTFKIYKLNFVIITLINLMLFVTTILLFKKCMVNFDFKNIFGITISTTLFLIVFRKFITHLKNIFEIKMDEKHLEINGKKYNWTDIKETYLAYEHQNKTTIFHFIIEKKNKEIEKYNLINFKLNDTDFCTQIEYLKNKK
jgi:hypothetical protein